MNRANPLRRALGVTLFALATQALAYPDKPVQYIIPFAPGGESDVTARLQAQVFSAKYRQEMIVLNKPGAGGALVWSQLNNMPGDGYTIAGVNLPHIVLQPLEPETQYKTREVLPGRPIDLDLKLLCDKAEARGCRSRMGDQDHAPKGLFPARREGLRYLFRCLVNRLDDGDIEEQLVHQSQNPAPDDVRAENPGEENYDRSDQDSQARNVTAEHTLGKGRRPGIEQIEQPGYDEDAGADGDEDE